MHEIKQTTQLQEIPDPAREVEEPVGSLAVAPETILSDAVRDGLTYSLGNGGLPHKGAAIEMHRRWFPDRQQH